MVWVAMLHSLCSKNNDSRKVYLYINSLAIYAETTHSLSQWRWQGGNEQLKAMASTLTYYNTL